MTAGLSQPLDMEDKEFSGHLIHQAVRWDNRDLLQDLLTGDQVCLLAYACLIRF